MYFARDLFLLGTLLPICCLYGGGHYPYVSVTNAQSNGDRNTEKQQRNTEKRYFSNHEENRKIDNHMRQKILSNARNQMKQSRKKDTTWHRSLQQEQQQSKIGETTTNPFFELHNHQQPNHRRITIICSATPVFKCNKKSSSVTATINQNKDDSSGIRKTCLRTVEIQQSEVLREIEKLYPDVVLLNSTKRLLNALFILLPIYPKEGKDDGKILSEDYIDNSILQLAGVSSIYPSEEFETQDVIHTAENIPDVIASRIQQRERIITTEEGTTNRTNFIVNIINVTFANPLEQIGVSIVRKDFCATGKGVKVAILDSGVDYTHIQLGGPGTIDSYTAAYGNSIYDVANTIRNETMSFPNDLIVDGYDFVGETLTIEEAQYEFYAAPDPNPIDGNGHGTAVASAVLAVAPDAEIVAVKVCLTYNNTCPDFAILQGLEYVLDPNGDGDMSDAVHIVNLSLGRKYTSPYYGMIAKAMEDIFELGVLPIVAAGNNGNIPYVMGDASSSPNVLSVGASSFVLEGLTPITIAPYSSRGPSADVSYTIAKPDLIAPGGPFGLAAAGSGSLSRVFEGTSFASPLVAGCAALLMEKCGPVCTPFVIRVLLMNSAYTNVQYKLTVNLTQFNNDTILETTERAPISLGGSGEIRIQNAFSATFWVYSIEPDMNPSISLGLINASTNVTISRTLRIVPIPGLSKYTAVTNVTTLRIGYEFRSLEDKLSGALSIELEYETITLNHGDVLSCLNTTTDGSTNDVFVKVIFVIDATKAPTNTMTFAGKQAINPEALDYHEYDGWITLNGTTLDDNNEYKSYHAVVPFHMILRSGANVLIEKNQWKSFNDINTSSSPSIRDYDVILTNNGTGSAQIDSYELLFVSADNIESARGSNNAPADLRYVGYRSIPVNGIEECNHLLEFAVTLWESKSTMSTTHVMIHFDTNNDTKIDYVLYNAGYPHGTPYSECRLVNVDTNEEICTGFPPDHSMNSANSVLRMCSNDLGMGQEGILQIAIKTLSFPTQTYSDETETISIKFPVPALSAPSYDIPPGGRLTSIGVSGSGTRPDNVPALGLLLLTNSYRTPERTGSSTKSTEAIAITLDNVVLPMESTVDAVSLPKAKDIGSGPGCDWFGQDQFCLLLNERGERMLHSVRNILSDPFQYSAILITNTNGNVRSNLYQTDESEIVYSNTCPELFVPRTKVGTSSPFSQPSSGPTINSTYEPYLNESLSIPQLSVSPGIAATSVPSYSSSTRNQRITCNYFFQFSICSLLISFII